MGLKKPSGLGASKKRRSNTQESQSNKRVRGDGDGAQQEVMEGEAEEVVMPTTGEGPVSDLASLYDKFSAASDQAEASGWLRGVMHEADRLLRHSHSPNNNNTKEEEEEEPLSKEDILRVRGFYGAALLRLGLLGPDLRVEGEPVQVREWLEVALPQLEQAPGEEFGWDLVAALWSLCAFLGEDDDAWLERARTESDKVMGTKKNSEGLLGLAGLVLPAASEAMSFQVTESLVVFLTKAVEALKEEREGPEEEEDVQAMLAEAQLVLGSKGADLLAEEQQGNGVQEATQKALRKAVDLYSALGQTSEENADEYKPKLAEALLYLADTLEEGSPESESLYERAQTECGVSLDDGPSDNEDQ